MPADVHRLERSRGPRECVQPRVKCLFHTMPTRMLRTRRSALCKLASSDCVDVECVDGWEINGMPYGPTYVLQSLHTHTHKQPEPKSQVRADDRAPLIGTRNSWGECVDRSQDRSQHASGETLCTRSSCHQHADLGFIIPDCGQDIQTAKFGLGDGLLFGEQE
jgi:hypothetical protein